MTQNDLNQEFQSLRQGFNDLDDQIIGLLNNRFELSIKMGKVKEQMGLATEDLSREQEIAQNIRSLIANDLAAQAIIQVYQEIIMQSKRLQTL